MMIWQLFEGGLIRWWIQC